ncbi:MAG: RNA 2',3'-cyclic phosphodiesterase, partial [Candidatus Omnitrophica bacterium]|nr:RNA 2',3'-cyclic phosphodiesterase [Candidatus Omnitrophota bacterium]
MSPDSIRAFLAIELNDQTRRKLGAIQDSLKKTNADIRWVDPKNIHLTLKFLGNVPSNTLEKLCSAIEKGLKGFSRFEFQLDSLGCFPPKGMPKILWAGVSEGSDYLEHIERSLTKQISDFCEKQENKKFSSHITLGRVRSNKNVALLINLLKESPCKLTEKQAVDHVTLFKSDLTPSGPIYS